MPMLESRSALKFHDLLFVCCAEKLHIRKSTGLADFMTERGHRTIQQTANRYLSGKTVPPPTWLKDFMRFAGLEAKDRSALFQAYLAAAPERLEALVELQAFVEEGEERTPPKP